MKTYFPVTLRGLFFILALPLCAQAGDPKAELDALVAQITPKIKAGQRTEAALASDLAQFDTLLAAHQGDKSDGVARILLMKATLYSQIIGNDEKSVVLLKQLKTDFPESTYAKGIDNM